VIDLEPLVVMKLTAFRTIDRVHLRDMIGVDLVNADWLDRLDSVLAARLSGILEDPHG
jgi:hypothetical protein